MRDSRLTKRGSRGEPCHRTGGKVARDLARVRLAPGSDWYLRFGPR